MHKSLNGIREKLFECVSEHLHGMYFTGVTSGKD